MISFMFSFSEVPKQNLTKSYLIGSLYCHNHAEQTQLLLQVKGPDSAPPPTLAKLRMTPEVEDEALNLLQTGR